MPAMTGQLKWAGELKSKMSFSVKSFKELNHPVCYREGAKLVFRKYKEMMSLLTNFEDEIFQSWNLGISKRLTQSLARPLVTRDEEGSLLRVNFGKDLKSVLREVRSEHLLVLLECCKCINVSQVRYLKREFPSREFPTVAGDLFQREDSFRNYVNSLDQTVTHYNKLKTQTKSVEFKLIKAEVADIDHMMERAEHALNWNSEGTSSDSVRP